MNDRTKDDVKTIGAGLVGLTFFYVLAVALNALGLVFCFWLKAFGHLASLDGQMLTAWAAGTGGLGAGSLIFKTIIEKMVRAAPSDVLAGRAGE